MRVFQTLSVAGGQWKEGAFDDCGLHGQLPVGVGLGASVEQDPPVDLSPLLGLV